MAGALTRGDVRLYRFQLPDKERPVVVLTRSSAIVHLNSVTIVPITSTIRSVPSEVLLTEADGMKSPCAVNLHRAVTVDKKHLGRRVASLGADRMKQICAALEFALGCGDSGPGIDIH